MLELRPTCEKSRLVQLIEYVKPRYESNGDASHDFAHIRRVMSTCEKIGASVNANLDVLLPAALLHDVINVPKNHPDRVNASAKAAEEALNILRMIGYSLDEIEKIQIVIAEHSYSLGKNPSCIESAVMQDADRLDALGAIGLMRMTTCGSRMGIKYYSEIEPFAKTRELDDKKFSLDHLYTKLFKLGEQFNTEAARIEGSKRIAFMKEFVEQIKLEIL